MIGEVRCHCTRIIRARASSPPPVVPNPAKVSAAGAGEAFTDGCLRGIGGAPGDALGIVWYSPPGSHDGPLISEPVGDGGFISYFGAPERESPNRS